MIGRASARSEKLGVLAGMAARLIARAGVIAAGALAAAGCAQRPSAEAIVKVSQTTHASPADRDCLARAMYFESHRGSDDGMLAVGTVVANRVKSGKYGSTYCEVVGQKRQFAAGVLSRPMNDSGAERARRAADAIVSGKRHPGVHDAMFFHTAGLRFPYPNMRYVLVAGGNAFYEKRSVASSADVRENAQSRAMALAYAKADPTAAAKPIMVASLQPRGSQATTVAEIATPGATAAAPAAVAQANVTTTASIAMTARPAAAPSPVAAPVAVARASVAPTPAPKAATQVAMAPEKPAAKTVAARTTATPAPSATVLASVATPPAAPARKAATPVRTISAEAAPVLASSAPTATHRAAPKTEPKTPVVAFAPEQAQPSFPSSGGSRIVANDGSPVAQAWASFQ